jgi:hypothetical protein
MITWIAWCESSSVTDRIPGNWWRDAIRISMTRERVYRTLQWEVDPDTTVLVSSTSYNQRGEPFQSIDLAAKEDRAVFDDAGRPIKLVENYVDPPFCAR